MPRRVPWVKSLTVLMVVLMGIGLINPGGWPPLKTAGATTQTNPSNTSATSLYLSNWQDLMGIWMASQLDQADTNTKWGPRLAELHYSANWSTNQLVDYSGFFRDETNAAKYDQIHNFKSTAYLDSNGLLNSTYGTYNGATLPVQIQRNYNLVPNQPFMVVQYIVTNPGTSDITWNVLDAVHVNNTQAGAGTNVHAWYDATRNALLADMSASGQYYLVLGALQPATSYQAGNDADSNTADATVAPWYAFDANGVLPDNADVTTPDVSMGFENRVTVPAGGSVNLYYYLTVRSTLADAQTAADTVRAQSGSYWLSQSATAWTSWLDAGKRVSTSDTGINTAFDRNLIMIKDSQNPTLGIFPATTNPASYSYKVWARDSAMTAIALDAAGHYREADNFWRWMAGAQNADGTWHTTFDLWTGSYISFVEPEHDSIGMFLVGVYRHYALTNDSNFLAAVYPAVQKAADFVNNNINSTLGLGPADNSIWEETLEYNTFTQAMYVAGLWAGARLAQTQGDTTRVDNYDGAASTIRSNVMKSYAWNPPGLWNETYHYFDRAVTTATTPGPRRTIDSSSDALVVFGVVDPNSARARDHLNTIEQVLTHDGFGLARYQGDTYYGTSPYSPAGDEAGSSEAVWPQMSMWAAVYETYTGQVTDALARLQWYASRSGYGYMPPGEAVSWVYQAPIVSTMSEPLTAASFIIATLTYEGQYSPRLYPLETNAGASASVDVTTNAAADWGKWTIIPYVARQTGSAPAAMADISRAYLANDSSNLYIRLDNAAGSFSGFNDTPHWAVHIYAEDFNHSTSTATSGTDFYGASLDRPMAYLVGRWNDSNDFSHFYVNGGAWTWDSNITSVIAPQWDVNTGRVELVVPISTLASGGSFTLGSWANLDLALAYQDPNTGTWTEGSKLQVHYRLTTSGTQWLYGDEQGRYLEDVYTDKSHYAPGSTVTTTVVLSNPAATQLSGAQLSLSYDHLGAGANPTQTATVTLVPGQRGTYTFQWTSPATDYQGYRLQATLTDANGNVLDTAGSAVDVSSDWTKFPRYGFLTQFGDQQSTTTNWMVSLLNDFHLNGIQFYDWQNKHHWPLAGTVSSPAASWSDVAGRTIYQHTVKESIAATHNFNMMAMNYNLLYGAWNGYGEDGSGVDYHWGLWWNNDGTNQVNYQLPAGWAATSIYVFNPADTNWQNYINAREQDVFGVYGFDGWHVDQLGSEGTTYDYSGSLVDLTQTFSPFLTAAKTALNKRLVFNAVGQYGQQQVAANPNLDFLYTENWPANGQATYSDLQGVVNNNRAWSGGKASVLAAYMDFNAAANSSDANPGFFNDPGVRLTNSTIFASGGAHIELGDGLGMLSNYYFPQQYFLMRDSLRQAVRDEYDFLVAYQNLLRDGEAPVSNQIALPGIATSTDGAAGTVWTLATGKTGVDVVHLINLLGQATNQWRDDNANYPAPPTQTNITLKYYYSTWTPTGVTWASPDANHGEAQGLSFTTGSDAGGTYLQVTVPQLQYWDMIWINH